MSRRKRRSDEDRIGGSLDTISGCGYYASRRHERVGKEFVYQLAPLDGAEYARDAYAVVVFDRRTGEALGAVSRTGRYARLVDDVDRERELSWVAEAMYRHVDASGCALAIDALALLLDDADPREYLAQAVSPAELLAEVERPYAPTMRRPRVQRACDDCY